MNIRRCSQPFLKATLRKNAAYSTISYLSDIEGDILQWERFLKLSKVVERCNKTSKIVFKQNNTHFVFGGDVCDRGVGDTRILKDLIQFYEDNSDRVHFIIGNRDANKLRLLFTLHESIVKNEDPKVYWLRREEDRELARKETSGKNAVEKLKYVLARTMGAPLAFRFRKTELSYLAQNNEVCDEDVVRSYLELLHPKHGLLTRYLKAAKIALIFEDTLFVHGAIKDHNINFVPSSSGNEKLCFDNLQQWTDCLNQFATDEMHDYVNRSERYLEQISQYYLGTDINNNTRELLWEGSGGYDHPQPGSRLVQYAMGWLCDTTLNGTVIYASYLNRKGEPEVPTQTVVDYLADNNIKRVIVGHQPNGDAPWVIRLKASSDREVLIVNADSAYSKNVEWPVSHLHQIHEHEDFQQQLLDDKYMSNSQYEAEYLGMFNQPTDANISSTRSENAVNEVLVSLVQKGMSAMRVHGNLSDGSFFDYTSNDESLPSDQSQYVGRKTKDGWYVKAANIKLAHNSQQSQPLFLLARNHGHSFKNKLVTSNELNLEHI